MISSLYVMKERKKISWPTAQYNNEMEHTTGLSEYDGTRNMLNINCKGKVPSKAAVAENWQDCMIRKFSMLFIESQNFSACTVVVYNWLKTYCLEKKQFCSSSVSNLDD